MDLNCQSTGERVGRDYKPDANHTPLETDTLNGSRSTRRVAILLWILALPWILALVVIAGVSVFEINADWVNQCPLSYAARDRIRGEWQKEVFVQENLRHEWQREEEEQRHKQEQKHKREEWKWEEEEQKHKREEWKREEEERKHKREEWKREVEEHDREKHERQKMGMFWNQVEAHQCTTSGTREYTAYLANLPIDYPRRVEACKETQLVIHGQSHFPKSCKDQGPGVMMGRWEVNHNEPDCVSFWDWFKNMVRSSLGL
ncbi:hypothetical protein BKA83DRAFT_4529825 [Pisolithus microcarpus]|nr:hypothetical protein BKA83DRAFT_4529825 [Pisolithus microcarpus]